MPTDSLLHLPADARARAARWALFGAALTAIAVGEATLLTVGLGRGWRLLASALLVYVSSAWLWIATAPFVVAIARRVPWPGTARPARAAIVILLHLAGIVAVAAMQAWWLRYAWHAFSPRIIGQPFLVTMLARLDLHLFTWLAIAGAVWAHGHWASVRAASLRAARLRGELVRTRLHVLTMQLQPHFLFNTLHGISELVHRDAASARRTAMQLRDLLRQSFAHATSTEVPLRDELRFLESYLGIQRTRFGAGLHVRIAVPPGLLEARVPCLVLQPLVENAIRHGLAPRGTGHIDISARRVGERLELTVRDDGRGLAGTRRERQGTGNTRSRLAQLYGDAQRFELRPAAGGGAEALVVIPYRTSQSSDAHEPHDDPSAAPSVRSRWPLVVVGVWSFWAVFWIFQSGAIALASGQEPPWSRALVFNPVNALLWTIATLAVAAAVRRWPARAERPVAQLAPHLLIALATAASLAVVRWRLFFAAEPFVVPGLGGWWAWDVTTYVVVAAFVQAGLLAERRRMQELRLASLETDLAVAQLDAIGWELRPERLAAALDEIADAAASDPERADELTTALGDLLREMLMRVAPGEPAVARTGVPASAQVRLEVPA